MKQSAFTLTACYRCESPVFRGWYGGFDIQLDRWTVPLRHAIILHRYGTCDVVALERRMTGLHGREFVARAEIKDGTGLYAVRHVCGTRHDPR